MLPDDDLVSSLLCYVEGDVDPRNVELVVALVAEMAESQDWVGGQPELVNEGTSEDWTLGLLVRLPSPSQDAEVEAAALADADRIVEAIERRTISSAAEFAFELNGVVVGWVAGGHRDRLLRDGLLGPWGQRVDELRGTEPA